MKQFSGRTLKDHKEDLEYLNKEEFTLEHYLPHVITVANQFPREQIAIGCLDINDLIQAGHEGAVRAWNTVNWELIENCENPQGKLWSFMKKSIKAYIRREIDNVSETIKTPRIILEQQRKNVTNQYLDKILVNIFPKFFDGEVFYEDDTSWQSVQLLDLIEDELERSVKIVDHRDILKLTYGIDYEKMSHKKIAEKYNKSVSYVQNIVSDTVKKMKNEEFKKIIENFYISA